MALPAFVLAALEDHLPDHVASAPDSPAATGLPLRRQDLSHAWSDASAAVGIDGVRPHDLRHHAATLIARNPNVTRRELMATIGHSSHVAALRYQHATAERSKEIADYLDSVISAAKGSKSVSESASVPVGYGMGAHGANRLTQIGQRNRSPNRANKKRRRAESNRRTGLCRPLPLSL